MKLPIKNLLGLIVAAMIISESQAEDYDLVINNGRVMDPETLYDEIANVGIRDGRIAVITQDVITGEKVIDASGHVVAPGFIDTHWHYDRPWSNKLALRDGRTSVMDLEVGTHGAYLAQWYRSRAGNNQVNYGQAVAHELARSAILDGFQDAEDTRSLVDSRSAGVGWCCRRPTFKEGNQILGILDQGLQAGALGIGTTVGYMREGVSARELFEIQRLAGHYGRQVGAHFRYTPGTDTTEANGIQELLANASALEAPALANHFNNPGYNLVHELLVLMRQRGMNAWGEIYPYAAGSTALNAVFLEPEMWVDTLGNRYEDTVQDVATGEWYTEETRARMIAQEPVRPVLVFKMSEAAVVDWLKLPGVSLVTDGMPMLPDDDLTWDTPYEALPNTHPRGAGSYAKALRLARENDIPLMQVLAMSSYNSARPLGEMGLKSMQERGRMQVGKVADITIFDPATVTDNATYTQGTLPSTGIPFVVVNGVVVVENSRVLKGVNPGQPIRFDPVESRFEPITLKTWFENYYVSPTEFDGRVPDTHPFEMLMPSDHIH